MQTEKRCRRDRRRGIERRVSLYTILAPDRRVNPDRRRGMQRRKSNKK